MQIQHITRQQRRSVRAERLQMVERFHRSGLTRVSFCRLEGIPLSTLNWWLTKSRRLSQVPAPVVFSELQVASPLEPATTPWAMEIASPSGMTIRCREALSLRDMARLLRGVRC